MPPSQGPQLAPDFNVSSQTVSSVPPPEAQTMLLEPRSPQSANPLRRSILKSPTFHFHFLIPPASEHADNTITPLSRHLTDKIPLELVHYCIDSLRFDKDTLKSCALVCKTWLARARPLLLPRKFTVTVNRQSGSEAFSILTARGSVLTNFVHTLCIQSTATFPLHYSSYPSSATAPDNHDPDGRSISFNHYLLPFIGASHSLRNITFQGIEIPPRAPQPISALTSQLRALPHLTRLELTRCAFWTFEELLLVICAPRSLVELVLADITVLHWVADYKPPPALRLPRRLSGLSLNTPGQTLILKWIISRDRIPPLRSVILGGVRETEEQKVIGLFLRLLGDSLEHVKLNLVRCTDGVDLSRNTNLRTLAISHYVISKVASENISTTGGLVGLLRQITSRHLTRIDINFVNAPGDVGLMPWAAVAQALRGERRGGRSPGKSGGGKNNGEASKHKFGALKVVRMRLAGKKARWEGMMGEAFGRLLQDGIVKIQWDSAA